MTDKSICGQKNVTTENNIPVKKPVKSFQLMRVTSDSQ